ncbi:MAG: hypothetical protein Q6353_012485 [Candidatus Sigynarchaeum springense]
MLTPIKRVLRDVSFGHCIKGGLLAVLGLLNTQMLVGIGRFQQNLVFVPFIYACVAIAGMLSMHVVHNQADSDRNLTKIARIACMFAIGGSIGLSIWYGITIEQEMPVITLTAVLCSAWVIIPVTLNKITRDAWIRVTMTTSTYSGGLLYGMLMNAYEIPLYSCFVIGGLFFLIFGRALVKECIQQRTRDGDIILPARSFRRDKGSSLSRPRSSNASQPWPGSQSPATSSSLASILGVSKSLLLSRYAFLIAIGCFVVPVFMGVWNYAFYSYLIVPACLVLYVVSHRLNGKGLTINQLDRIRKNASIAVILVVIGLVLQSIF